MTGPSTIRLVRANPLVTVQDAGRFGAMRYGVSQSGPMDRLRFALATALAGGARAAFEIGIAGAEFAAEGPVGLALAGPGFVAAVSGGRSLRIAAPARLTLEPDERLTVLPGDAGMWAYLAVEGIDFGAPVLGSWATNVRTGLGGRDLAAGFACAAVAPRASEAFADPLEEGPVGVLPGPQHHLFAPEAHARLVAAPYRLTEAVDRMGYRLEGAPLGAACHDIISDGVVEGAIQVPGNGQPIVLCADRNPTGGYPKIAVVARVDRPRLTQRRPGETVRFVWTTPAAASERLANLRVRLAAPERRIEASGRALAEVNLIGGVWGRDEPDSD